MTRFDNLPSGDIRAWHMGFDAGCANAWLNPFLDTVSASSWLSGAIAGSVHRLRHWRA